MPVPTMIKRHKLETVFHFTEIETLRTYCRDDAEAHVRIFTRKAKSNLQTDYEV